MRKYTQLNSHISRSFGVEMFEAAPSRVRLMKEGTRLLLLRSVALSLDSRICLAYVKCHGMICWIASTLMVSKSTTVCMEFNLIIVEGTRCHNGARTVREGRRHKVDKCKAQRYILVYRDYPELYSAQLRAISLLLSPSSLWIVLASI